MSHSDPEHGNYKLSPNNAILLWNFGMDIAKLNKGERDLLASSFGLKYDRKEQWGSFRALCYRKASQLVAGEQGSPDAA